MILSLIGLKHLNITQLRLRYIAANDKAGPFPHDLFNLFQVFFNFKYNLIFDI